MKEKDFDIGLFYIPSHTMEPVVVIEDLKRARDEAAVSTNDDGGDGVIVCYERLDREKLQRLSTTMGVPIQQRFQLQRILASVDGSRHPDQRVQVCYSTKKGDPEGRLYGNIVITEIVGQRLQRRRTEQGVDDVCREVDVIRSNGGLSLQGLSGWIRRIIASEFYTDYDIVNCAPVLLEQILRGAIQSCPSELTRYNTDRDALIGKYVKQGGMTRGDVKKAFLVVMHMGESNSRIPETRHFRRELRETLLVLSRSSTSYSELYDSCFAACSYDTRRSRISKEALETKTLGKFCAIVWNRAERQVLMSMREYFIACGCAPDRMVLCFDGIMVEKHAHPVSIAALEAHVTDRTGYRVRVEEKSLAPTPQDQERAGCFT